MAEVLVGKGFRRSGTLRFLLVRTGHGCAGSGENCYRLPGWWQSYCLHTGVLSRLLRPDVLDRYRVTGISGTSGGAICALLGWSALMDADPASAEPRLRAFWADNSASTPVEWFVNAFLQWSSELSHFVALPTMSPYQNPASAAALKDLQAMLDRAVDFDDLRRRAVQAGSDAPQLLLGAVAVLSGAFKAFDSRRGEVSVDAVLASAAIPTLFRSVPVEGGLYCDGLFSQNPPVRDLLDDLPDEVWVIQINPTARDEEPDTVETIADRRNELAGNLSLYQELAFIEGIDSML
jgi:NTE family protein